MYVVTTNQIVGILTNVSTTYVFLDFLLSTLCDVDFTYKHPPSIIQNATALQLATERDGYSAAVSVLCPALSLLCHVLLS